LKTKPYINFDKNSNVIKFEGIFMALSSWEKKGVIIAEVEQYIDNKENISVEFNLIYVDSMSRKIFFEIFNVLKISHDDHTKNINIIWKYDPEDDTILELGKVLEEVVNYPVTFVEVPD
jgi:hypothetical protein